MRNSSAQRKPVEAESVSMEAEVTPTRTLTAIAGELGLSAEDAENLLRAAAEKRAADAVAAKNAEFNGVLLTQEALRFAAPLSSAALCAKYLPSEPRTWNGAVYSVQDAISAALAKFKASAPLAAAREHMVPVTKVVKTTGFDGAESESSVVVYEPQAFFYETLGANGERIAFNGRPLSAVANVAPPAARESSGDAAPWQAIKPKIADTIESIGECKARPGTKAAAFFALLKPGMTLKAAYEAADGLLPQSTLSAEVARAVVKGALTLKRAA